MNNKEHAERIVSSFPFDIPVKIHVHVNLRNLLY